MQEELTSSTVIGHIYEASYKPEYWPIALENISKFTHSNSAALLYNDNELERANGAHTYNIPHEHMHKYNAYGIDPNFKIFAENIGLCKAAAVDHIISDRNELDTIYGEKFSNIMLTTDLYHIGGTILFMDDVRTAAIALQRTKAMGTWTEPQIDKLNELIPHLQRAINIQKEFVRLQTREHALRHGLDRLLMGLILFDKELQPIYINPVAESILNYHPAIEMKHDKVYASDHDHTFKIHSALIAAISSSMGAELTETSTSLGLKHPDCTTVLPVIISAVHDSNHRFSNGNNHVHAVMCFSDPERTYPIEADKLATVYELTPTESQVAISIANGVQPDEIATMHSVAISTVRSQLKSIYRKLGVTTQAELVKILLTGPFGQCI